MISEGEFALPYSRFVNWGADKERGNSQRIKQVESALIIKANIPFFKLVNRPCSSTNLLATIYWEESTALLYNDRWFFSVEAEQFNMQVSDTRTFLIKMYIMRIFFHARVSLCLWPTKKLRRTPQWRSFITISLQENKRFIKLNNWKPVSFYFKLLKLKNTFSSGITSALIHW